MPVLAEGCCDDGGPAPPPENVVVFEVDFGFAAGGQGVLATATVPAAWLTDAMGLVVLPAVQASADHGPEDGAAEQLWAQAIHHVAGVEFDVEVHAPNGAWGRYMMVATGVAP